MTSSRFPPLLTNNKRMRAKAEGNPIKAAVFSDRSGYGSKSIRIWATAHHLMYSQALDAPRFSLISGYLVLCPNVSLAVVSP